MLLGIGFNVAVEVGEVKGCLVEGVCVAVADKGTGGEDRGDTVCVNKMFSGIKTTCSGGERAYLMRAVNSATLQPKRSWTGGRL